MNDEQVAMIAASIILNGKLAVSKADTANNTIELAALLYRALNGGLQRVLNDMEDKS